MLSNHNVLRPIQLDLLNSSIDEFFWRKKNYHICSILLATFCKRCYTFLYWNGLKEGKKYTKWTSDSSKKIEFITEMRFRKFFVEQ